MASIQAKLIKTYLRLKRVFNQPVSAINISTERGKLESQAALLKTLVEYRTQPTLAKHVRAEWLEPAGDLGDRVLLYLHGGAYYTGSIGTHRIIAVNSAWAAKAKALLIDYRLAPENPFPAALDDARAAYEWLLEQGYYPDKLVVAGDSAGGGLALALMLELREHDYPMPAALVCYSPWTDLSMKGETYTSNKNADLTLSGFTLRQAAELYLGQADPCTPKASPIYGDLRGFPPVLIQVGSEEILLSDSMGFFEKAKAAGVDIILEIWPGMQHEWQYAASILPEGRQALRKVGEYLDQRFS